MFRSLKRTMELRNYGIKNYGASYPPFVIVQMAFMALILLSGIIELAQRGGPLNLFIVVPIILLTGSAILEFRYVFIYVALVKVLRSNSDETALDAILNREHK